MGVPVFQYNYLGEQVAGQIWLRTNLPTPDLHHYLCSIQLPFMYSVFLQTMDSYTVSGDRLFTLVTMFNMKF